jgi:hypothetical protein
MGANAFWTAARHDLLLLITVDNNDAGPDLAALVRSLGLRARGPVTDPAELDATLVTARASAAEVLETMTGGFAGVDPLTPGQSQSPCSTRSDSRRTSPCPRY